MRWLTYGLAASVAALTATSALAAAQTPRGKRKTMNVYPAASVAARGTLTVDGDLTDWKPEAFVEMFADFDLRDTFALHIATAYDEKGLLVAARFVDKSPLINHIDPAVDPFKGWSGDSLQMRFISDPAPAENIPKDQQNTDRMAHVTTWYYTDGRLPVIDIRYGMDFHGTRTLTGAASGLAFKEAPGGYVMEGRIPWNLLNAAAPAPGARWRMTVQPLFGDAAGKHVHDFFDIVRAPGFQFQGADGWGYAEFVPAAEVAERLAQQRQEEARLMAAALPAPPSGYTIPVRYDNPKKGFVSLAICQPDGRIVRTLLTKAPREKGPQTEAWDGRDDDGQPAPAGRYVLKALVHDGITPRYVTSVMQSGTPPWGNSGKYGWGGDHGVPIGATGDEAGNVYLMWTHNEGGDYLIKLDPQGVKQWGDDISWGDFTGDATAVCYSDGRLYIAKDGLDSKPGQPARGGLFVNDAATGRRVAFPNGQGTLPLTEWTRERMAERRKLGALPEEANILGLAASPDRLFVALHLDDKIVALDKKTFAVAETYAVPRPAGLAYDRAKNALYAVSGEGIVRLDLAAGGKAAPVVSGGLEVPFGLALDFAGSLYVSTRGKQMQVRVYSPEGRLVRTIGKTGGRPALGKFDDGGIYHPSGLYVDGRGRVWVTESDTRPERISLWDAKTGKLARNYWGTSAYAPMMAPDPENPEQVYLHDTRFIVDYEKGTFRPDSTVYRRDYLGSPMVPGSEQGFGFMGNSWQVATIGGRKFAYNGHGGIFSYGDVFRPLRYTGQGFVGAPKLDPKMGAHMSNIVWHDTDRDGILDESEVRRVERQSLANNIGQFGGAFFPGGTFIKGRRIFAPSGLDKNGVPIYPEPEEAPPILRDGGEMARYHNWLDVWPSLSSDWREFYAIASLPAPNGSMLGGGGDSIIRFDRNGAIKWRYPRATVHFALKAPLAKTGDLTGALRIAGEVRMPKERGGEIVGIGCYRGYFGFLTEEGLFVDQVGYDNGRGPAPNFDVFYIENFSGYFFQHPRTKKVYLFCGDVDARILELQGWDTLRRFDAGEMSVTAEQSAQVATSSATGATVAAGPVAVTPGTPAVDGTLAGWDAVPAAAVALDEARQAQVRLAYDAQNLYARFEVADDSPWKNAAPDWRHLFKGGDAVDIQIGAPAGPLRVMIAPDEAGSGCRAVAMWKTVPAGMAKEPMLYKSPTGEEGYERVALLPTAHCTVRKTEKGYTVAATIPWSALGMTAPAAGAALKGDVGVLQSDPSGTRTTLRRYRYSQDTTVINDIPTEVRMLPANWGELTFGRP